MTKPNATVLKKLYHQILKQNEWGDSLPKEINLAFCDNPLTEGLHNSLELLIDSYFGESWSDLICSILWCNELNEEYPITFTLEDGSKKKVESIDGLCDYLVEFEEWTK